MGRVTKIIKELGFEIKKKKKYYWCSLRQEGGRIHLQFTELSNGEIYVDLHFDKTLHLFFINVDYKEKPAKYFFEYLKPILESQQIEFRVQDVNWFSRKNKAILTGLRI